MIITIKKMLRFGSVKVEYLVLSVLNFLIPKSSNIIYIYDKKYKRDNAWVIKEELKKINHDNRYKIYYYTMINNTPNDVIYVSHPLRALWARLRSRYVFYSYEGMKKIKPCRNQIVINTMHGSPLKNIGYLASNSKFKKMWRYEKDFTHILCVSNFFKDIIKKSFGAREEQCLVIGYPRNDRIFHPESQLLQLDIDKDKYSKIVLWMPTWRGKKTSGTNKESVKDFPILTKKNACSFDNFLRKENILVLLKPHPIQLELGFFSYEFKNIKILTDSTLIEKKVFLYDLFNEVDALITDYSSVYFDFLLTDKPIGFTLDDFESYGGKRGFVVDNPTNIMPGNKIYNLRDLENFVTNVKTGKDEYYLERKNINNLVNEYQDGSSTERLFEKLQIK